jgi:hypothetical protein
VVEPESVSTTGARQVKLATKGIEQARYLEVKRARDICLIAVVLEERFQLVLDNYTEWECELLNQAQAHLLGQTNSRHSAMQKRLTLDRRLMNLLSAFRLYLDQTDNTISEVFGNPSVELETIKKFKNGLYDSCFGYRFLEALRNHVQHCGLPIEIITFNSGFVGRDPKNDVQFSVIPNTTLETLASDKEFKKAILDEVKSLGEKIDLRLPIREYVSCIVSLHDEVRKVFSKVISDSKESYSKAVKKYSMIDEHAVRHPRLECHTDSGKVEETVHLILDFLDRYELLHGQNSNVRNVTKSFVSNVIESKC